jgi:hypothetical protein
MLKILNTINADSKLRRENGIKNRADSGKYLKSHK